MRILIGILLTMTLTTPPAARAAGSDIYVAPAGRNDWSGRLKAPNRSKTDGPIATLTGARDAARRLRTQRPGEALRIVVRSGEYYLDAPLDLTSTDTGLTIEAAKGEKPILYGGRRIEGWQPDGSRFWSAPVPEAVGRKWDFRLLVVNGAPRPRARLPETGFFTHLTDFDVPWMSTTGGGWKRKPTEEELTTLRYRPDDLGLWLDVNSAELTVYHMWDQSVVGVKSLDPATQTIRFSNPAGHPPGAFGVHDYVVWNVREGMKRPGQWYLDHTAGKVVYWPLPGEDMAKAVVMAPVAESVFRITGTKEMPASEITIRGLRVELTNTPLKAGGFGAGEFAGAVSLYQSRNCRIEDLTVTNAAGQGINAWNSPGLRIIGCEVNHTGACGIRANSDRMVVSDNDVHDVGILYSSAVGIWSGGAEAEVSHNAVYNAPYSGIIGAGNGSRYEANLIHDVMREMHDGGGIYVTFCKNVTIRGNVIRDIVDTGGYGASAYYLDEQAEGCVVEGNLSANVARPSHNHMARANTLRNNVFIVPGDGRLTFPRCSGYTLDHNVIVAGGSLTFEAPADGIASMPWNVLFSKTGKLLLKTLQDYATTATSALSHRDGTVVEDPLIAESKYECRFQPDSPAAKLGIRPLDLRSVGPRKRRDHPPR